MPKVLVKFEVSTMNSLALFLGLSIAFFAAALALPIQANEELFIGPCAEDRTLYRMPNKTLQYVNSFRKSQSVPELQMGSFATFYNAMHH